MIFSWFAAGPTILVLAIEIVDTVNCFNPTARDQVNLPAKRVWLLRAACFNMVD